MMFRSLGWLIVLTLAATPIARAQKIYGEPDTGTPVDDKDYQVPFAFTGTIEKITLSIDRPRLTPEDEKKLMEAERSNRASE